MAGFKHIKDVLAPTGLIHMAKLHEEREALFAEVAKLRKIADHAKVWKVKKHAAMLEGLITPTAYAGMLSDGIDKLAGTLEAYCDYVEAMKADTDKEKIHADA